jgi:hypothetical protein
VQARTDVTLYDDTVATDEIDAAKRMAEMTDGVPAGQVRRFTLQGRSAIQWWTQAPPPQPGCAGCPGDPGPDIVTISLVADVDLRLVELTASARVNAAPDVFCDIQAIELGVTFP